MMYDVVIIGAGPAGLTAAIYTSRSRLKTLLIESFTTPGQAVTASDIENYPGFPEGLNGFELIDKFKKQAERFGTEFKVGNAKAIRPHQFGGQNAFEIEFDSSSSVISLSVIVASGSCPKKLDVPGEDKFSGRGVSYCAVCDGTFFKDKDIVVVGGGNTAVEEAIFLTKFANKVTLIHRRGRLRADKILEERAAENKKINFVLDSVVKKISGDDKVKSVETENVKTGEKSKISCEGVFIMVGYIPNTDFIKGIVKIDSNGYIITDESMKTSGEGIFACGDVRKKLLRQVVTAAGDGATAAHSARMYVEELKGIAYK